MLLDLHCGIILGLVILYISMYIHSHKNVISISSTNPAHTSINDVIFKNVVNSNTINNNTVNNNISERKVKFDELKTIINPSVTNNNNNGDNILSESEFIYNNTKPFPNNNLKPFQPNDSAPLESNTNNINLVQQKINDLLINYTDFSNFINFSSAELRSKIAKSKISKYGSYETSKNQIKNQASSTSNISISASYSNEITRTIDEQILLWDSCDEYESYRFYPTANIDQKIEDGIAFDKSNYNSLFYQLPEYIKNEESNADYLKFTAMVGHFLRRVAKCPVQITQRF